MKKRKFKAEKEIDFKKFGKEKYKGWKPKERDKELIRKRIKEKIKLKKDFYKYYGEKPKVFLRLAKDTKIILYPLTN